MSLADELAALTAASRDFDERFGPRLAQKVEATETADETVLLVGQNINMVRASLEAPLNQHAATVTAHAETAARIGGRSKADIDAMFAGVPSLATIPISRYGDLGYLPAGVAGSFEGASTNDTWRNVFQMLENDGTLVYLRNGINGSKQGVYYAHLKEALQGTELAEPIKTNRRYQPSFFPVGQTAAYIESGHSNPSVLVGRLQNVQGVPQNYFVALTNGTLDDTVHTGGFITPAVHGAQGIGRGVSFVADDKVWFLTPDLSDGFQIQLSWAPVASFTNGAVVTPTKVTGVTSTGFGGVVYTADAIKLAAKINSTVVADKPVLHCAQADAWVSTFHYDIPALVVGVSASGQWRIKVNAFTWGAYGLAGQGLYMAFTLLYNPVTKVATLEAEFQPQSTLSFPAGVATLAGPIYDWNIVQEGSSGATNSAPSYCYSGKHLFTYRQFQGSDSMVLSRAEYGSSIGLYDRLKRNSVTHIGNVERYLAPSYGSAAGSDLTAAQFISPTMMLFHAKGRRADGSYAFTVGYTATEATADYDYNSLNNGPMKGFKPSKNRGFLADHGVADPLLTAAGGVTEVGSSTMSYSTLRFHGERLTGQINFNDEFVSDEGTYSTTSAVLRQAAQSGLSLANLNDVLQFTVELVVPKLLAGLVPPFAVISYLTSTGLGAYFIAEVALTFSGSNITGAVATKVSPRTAISSAVSSIGTETRAMGYMGGYSLYRNGDDVLIGGTGLNNFRLSGGAPTPSFRFRYNVTAKQWTWPTNLATDAFHYNAGYRGYAAHPVLGFGRVFGTEARTDTGTKLVFVPIGKTAAEFDNYVEPAVANWRVLVSQDVAEGWALYFTEPTPILLNGIYAVIAPTQFDLLSLTPSPANKVFYIYAERPNSTNWIRYQISLSKLEENSQRMYLGYVATGASSIETLALEKVTQFGGYRLSPVARGGAIAATTGPVSDPATLPWS